MPRHPSAPFLRPVTINGKLRFRLAYHLDGKRTLEHFTDEGAAKSRLDEITARLKEHGKNFLDLPLSLRADAVAARLILSGTGMSLSDAARKAMDGVVKAKTSVGDAVDEFLKSRDYRSDKYRGSLRGILAKFVLAFPARSLDSISRADIDGYLDGVGGTTSSATRNHTRTVLGMVFERGISLGNCRTNPVKLTKKVQALPPPIQILSPAECLKLLKCCHPDILAGVVLRLFCFIRETEIHRLKWSSVTLDGDEPKVILSRQITKTGQSRKVSIPSCALSWLPKAPCDGLVLPDTQAMRQLWDESRMKAGWGPFQSFRGDAPKEMLKPWPRNTLRHSGISYLLASTKDLSLVEYEAGNSANVIRRHYDGQAEASDAAKFYGLESDSAG